MLVMNDSILGSFLDLNRTYHSAHFLCRPLIPLADHPKRDHEHVPSRGSLVAQ